jgi:hypothetical protein
MTGSCVGFDEATYLTRDLGVRDAVHAGSFSSGWEHYVCHRYYEHLLGVAPGVHKAMGIVTKRDSQAPFPPQAATEKGPRYRGPCELQACRKNGGVQHLLSSSLNGLP